MEEIKIGDVVRLKSGSEKMTVENVEGEKTFTVWFEGSSLCRETIKTVLLEKVN